jgi:hypothetical protein
MGEEHTLVKRLLSLSKKDSRLLPPPTPPSVGRGALIVHLLLFFPPVQRSLCV